MSNTIRGGRSIDLNVQAGESLKVSTLTGTYTATVLAGAGAGTALATDSSGGATYGPYAAGVVIRVKCSADGLADIDVGTAPALGYYPNALFATNDNGDVTGLVDGAGNISLLNIVHPRYWFHGFAPSQSTDDAVFRDLVAGNNGVFGVNLTKANAWTNKAKGYISNVDPTGGTTDSVIRIPGPNFDYNGGQSLLIWWAGQCTPEGSDTHLMGSSASSAAGGMAVRLLSTGRLSFVLYGGGDSRFSSTTTDNAAGKPFVAGEYHTFGILVNGRDKTQSMWVDGQINVSEAVLSSGDPVDTLSSATWNIGTAAPAGGTTGVAANTLAFAGLKFLASDTLPTVGQITAAFQALGRDPRGLILVGAL